jgi:hypothetical protein
MGGDKGGGGGRELHVDKPKKTGARSAAKTYSTSG